MTSLYSTYCSTEKFENSRCKMPYIMSACNKAACSLEEKWVKPRNVQFCASVSFPPKIGPWQERYFAPQTE